MAKKLLALSLVFLMVFLAACSSAPGETLSPTEPSPDGTPQEVTPSPSPEAPSPSEEPEIQRPGPVGDREEPQALPENCILRYTQGTDEYLARPEGTVPGSSMVFAVDLPTSPEGSLSAPGILWGNVFEGLLYMYMNDPEDVRGLLAESWSVSGDGLTYSFTLREGMCFSDGAAVSAEAVCRGWDAVCASGAVFPIPGASWSPSGELDLELSLPAPFPDTAAYLCTRVPVLKAEALEEYGPGDVRGLVATGPYAVRSYDAETGSLELSANTYYRFAEKIPCTESITVIRYGPSSSPDAVADAAVLGSNTVRDKGERGEYGWTDLRADIEKLVPGSGDGHVCAAGSSTLWLNCEFCPELQDITVRKAVCRLLDMESVAQAAFSGCAAVQDGIWPRGTELSVETDGWYFDPDEGMALLAQAGLSPGDVSLPLCCSYSDRGLFTAIAAALTRQGLDVPLYILPKEEYLPAGQGTALASLGVSGYMGMFPRSFLQLIMDDFGPYRFCLRQDLYDPELRGRMTEAWARLNAAPDEDSLQAGRQLTAMIQDDFAAVGGVEVPCLMRAGEEVRNIVLFLGGYGPEPQFYYAYAAN